MIARSGVAAAIMGMQTAAAMTARGQTLQQRRAFSHSASGLMRSRPGVGIEPGLVGLKRWPIDEAGMVVGNEHGPFIEGKLTYPFLDGAVFIDITFASALAVGVSASIHRIGEDVMQRGVRRSDPADLAPRTVL